MVFNLSFLLGREDGLRVEDQEVRDRKTLDFRKKLQENVLSAVQRILSRKGRPNTYFSLILN